jgi:hypothetical protein
MSHHKKSPTGLDVTDLPLKDGGKNAPLAMRQTSFVNSVGAVLPQVMQTDDGKPKGLRSILTERGLWRNKMLLQCQPCEDKISHTDRIASVEPFWQVQGNQVLKTEQCCAKFCLSNQPDFKSQRPWLKEVVEDDIGATIIYYPKFHCELNYIEMVWAYIKAYLRRNCTYTFKDLKLKLESLESMVPVEFIRRASRHCFRFMSCYRFGLCGPLADFAMTKYSSHRGINENLAREVERSYEEQNVSKKSKRS